MGFGDFQVRWGIGAYGEELNACIRRMSAYGKGRILSSGARCLITNRTPYRFPTLWLRTFRKGKSDNKAATLADLIPATVEDL